MRFFEELKTAANDVNLELSEKQYEQFIKYMRLVQEWNEKINLTAITEDEEFIKKHFVDCLREIIQFLQGRHADFVFLLKCRKPGDIPFHGL